MSVPQVREGWTGPGRRDSAVKPLAPEEDGIHIDIHRKGMYEWWYFDAHFETGETLVVFFYAANPNPGAGGKPGVEIVLLRPDGRRTQRFVPCSMSDFAASSVGADVRIGGDYVKATQLPGELPVYEVRADEGDLGCRLTFRAEVNGWKPGTGVSQFGKLGTFAWVVPFARASVEGTIVDGDRTLQVKGVGYHDHNWLDFPFQSIIDYWMWGRIYSQHYTVSYAFIQCNEKVGNHAVKVLMLANGREVELSTGEFEFGKENFEYNPKAKHRYPRRITISVPDKLEITLDVKKVLEAQDMLESFSLPLRLIARHLLRLRPGYFRLESAFEIDVTSDGAKNRERGTALHEIVLFRSGG
ncbi:MAG TPA: hypothetical protein VMS77_02570 [Conexivisphaerales archaeon]|nr:hypothetical protein [Conexivisphaerales archaeon]